MPVLLPSSLATQKQEQVVRGGGGGRQIFEHLKLHNVQNVYNKKDKNMETFLLLSLSLFLTTHTLFHLPLYSTLEQSLLLLFPCRQEAFWVGKLFEFPFACFTFDSLFVQNPRF